MTNKPNGEQGKVGVREEFEKAYLDWFWGSSGSTEAKKSALWAARWMAERLIAEGEKLSGHKIGADIPTDRIRQLAKELL